MKKLLLYDGVWKMQNDEDDAAEGFGRKSEKMVLILGPEELEKVSQLRAVSRTRG